ncbi:MAG: hypothetical protein C0621_08665 [Desulfuromonas sp.]|nr:MAG: hypothetical protein C0621_08665 [Desulfuromonas sp.]
MIEPAAPPDPPRILLAEDDRELRDLLAFSLFRAGYAVAHCSNGLELLEKLDPAAPSEDAPYALVLTDLRMPALTGLEVLEALHDLPDRPPFICMTAFGDPETHALAARLGALCTVDKPFRIEELMTLIDRQCRPHIFSPTTARSLS